MSEQAHEHTRKAASMRGLNRLGLTVATRMASTANGNAHTSAAPIAIWIGRL